MENNLKSLILPVFYCVLVTIISIWDFDSSNLPSQYISDKLAHSLIYLIFVLIWYKPLYMVYNKSLLFIVLFFISACSSIPSNTSNSCSIFGERYLWYKHAKKSEKKWGTPVYLQLAIIKMESDFDWLAKPPRQKLFKVIPYKRPSSSFGYSQAVNGTWEQYKKETGNKLAVRTRFKDSVDFIGWYTNKSESILKISKKDAFKQYVAYHEGWGGFKNYKNNKKIINLAKRVEEQSNIYKKQLSKCSSSLTTNKYIIF